MPKIIETDNFGRDYPNESFVLDARTLSQAGAEAIATILNREWSGDDAPRYWRAVPDDYRLQPGFEP